MITTADWLQYIESLGPTDPDSLRMRLETAGADPARAAWLMKIGRTQRAARSVVTAAVPLLAIALGASARQWWLALHGRAIGHEPRDIYIVAAIIALASFALLFGSALQLSLPMDLSYREVPPELSVPPRNVALRRKVAPSIGLGAAVLCFMCAPFTLAVIQVRNDVLLRDRGVETTGHVTETYATNGSKGGRNYHVAYEFALGHGVRGVSAREFSTYRTGDPIPVTYLPSNPEVNEGRHKDDVLRSGFGDPALVGIIAYAVIIAVVVALLAWVQDRSRLRLAERGIAMVGVVTRSSRQIVDYRFGEREGRYRWAKKKLRERPAAGQPLVILYDPEKPARNLPLGVLGDVEFR